MILIPFPHNSTVILFDDSDKTDNEYFKELNFFSGLNITTILSPKLVLFQLNRFMLTVTFFEIMVRTSLKELETTHKKHIHLIPSDPLSVSPKSCHSTIIISNFVAFVITQCLHSLKLRQI